MQLISNQEVLALAGIVLSFFEPRALPCEKRVQTKKCGASGFLPIALLLTSPASEESRSIFLTNRVLPETLPSFSAVSRGRSGGQIRSAELLDEFTF